LWLHPLRRDGYTSRPYKICEFVAILILWKSSPALVTVTTELSPLTRQARIGSACAVFSSLEDLPLCACVSDRANPPAFIYSGWDGLALFSA